MSLLQGIRVAVMTRLTAVSVTLFLATISFGTLKAVASNPVMTLTEYSVDGENSGTARLSRNVTIDATIPGNSAPAVTWSVTGGGTITSAGIYSSPAAMTSGGTVTVTAKLVSNTAVTASYTMKLIYNAPNIHWLTPAVLVSGATNSVQVGGLDFTAATTIKVNGTAVAATFNGTSAVIAQIPIAAGSLSSVQIVASNPTPGGGVSPIVAGPVTPITIAVSSYSTTAANPTTLALGQKIQFAEAVSGGNTAMSWPVTWSLQGGGTLSSAGLYTSPTAMPSSASVVVTATLTANSAVKTTYAFTLKDPTPIINQSEPAEISTIGTNKMTFYGENFTPSTTIQWNGHTVATTYVSSSEVTAAVYLNKGITKHLYITATNPAPSGGVSNSFLLPIGDTGTVSAVISTTPGRAIPGDFVGLSHEWGVQNYMGTAATGVNNIYRQLVKNLSNPGSPFFIRIGGVSTDSSTTATIKTTEAFSELAAAMPVKFALGVNLADDNLALAEQQASFFAANIPSGSLAAIEIGNEPDSYTGAGLRPASYNYTGYFTDLANFTAGIVPLLPSGVKIMGPAFNDVWHLEENLSTLETQEEKNISIVSAHDAAGYEGTTNGVVNTFPADYLLRESTITKDITKFEAIAPVVHAAGQSFRIAETNTIDLGGLAGVSNTFSASLYVADVMFAEAAAGVDGVNWHGVSGCGYCSFTFGIQAENGLNSYQLEQVNPIYYGLLFFHDATQNSAKLLPVTVTSNSNVKVWATVDASGTTRVAILNKDEDFTGNVSITLPGYSTATAITMAAPNFQSVTGITIGGQTFDNSFDGNLVGSAMSLNYAPTNSVYTIPMQPMSAVLLTLTK